jgi:hypothetical protein
MAYDDATRHDDPIFRDLLEHHLRTAKFFRLVLVYTEHYELHAPIIYCDSEACRLVAQHPRAARPRAHHPIGPTR